MDTVAVKCDVEVSASHSFSESESCMAYSTDSRRSNPEDVRYLRKADERQPPARSMKETVLPDSIMSVAIPRRKACQPTFGTRPMRTQALEKKSLMVDWLKFQIGACAGLPEVCVRRA